MAHYPPISRRDYIRTRLTPTGPSDEAECPICHDAWNAELLNNIVATHCAHVFHKACILEWFLKSDLDNNNTCPFCRRHCFVPVLTTFRITEEDTDVEVIAEFFERFQATYGGEMQVDYLREVLGFNVQDAEDKDRFRNLLDYFFNITDVDMVEGSAPECGDVAHNLMRSWIILEVLHCLGWLMEPEVWSSLLRERAAYFKRAEHYLLNVPATRSPDFFDAVVRYQRLPVFEFPVTSWSGTRPVTEVIRSLISVERQVPEVSTLAVRSGQAENNGPCGDVMLSGAFGLLVKLCSRELMCVVELQTGCLHRVIVDNERHTVMVETSRNRILLFTFIFGDIDARG
ncbi:hypothetical protein BU26DRAFT_330892 [Trematosphaeria pertusa]|uniref:RING-type domain-containing protein n=1 Tax=Trematosphaeria pertusa TaxID=390896 RepID=A0A6A6ICI7_9PLEO|nr:uncharacterized protein BU26DRAFT_330892 [Trematosphaeria pertusa]KAF2248294.1 hypothetical protein BU26DRAFT_330892 [Trematosphaeria pertusa]